MYPLAANQKAYFKGGFVLLLVVALAILFFAYQKAQDTPLNKAVKDIRAGKAARALPVLEELSRNNPDDPSLLPWLAQGYLSCDRIAEGRTALDTALHLRLPAYKLSPMILAFSEYYQRKNDYLEASKLFELLGQAGQDTQSDNELAQARGQLYINWAHAEAAKGDLKSAIEKLETVLRLETHLTEPAKALINRRLGEYFRELAANAELKEQNDATAIELLNKSLSYHDDPVTRMDLAAIYIRQKKWNLAVENYHQVVAIDPNNLEARHRLVELYVMRKEYEKARDTLVELTTQEGSVENFQLLAALQLKLNNKAGAVRALEDACAMREGDLTLLAKLKDVLLSWSRELAVQGKVDEAASVKGHAERVADMIALVMKAQGKKEASQILSDPAGPKIALLSSRIWLARGSLTPEGEVNIKNVSANPATDLSLNVVFYDKTVRRSCGSVSLPVATADSPALPSGAERTLYFSCPTTVAPDHQLAVLISWRGHVLKELPVVKHR
ncbi:MAG: tetratricopeptide repeat protein [Candidatus Obscuribacterales bacterium]|nr:tetratricopeptide repeat protein [Candidatus Obscuribacterales bacterium]